MANYNTESKLNYSLWKLGMLVLVLKTEQNKIKSAQKRISTANKNIAKTLKGNTKSAYEVKTGSDEKLFDKQMKYLEELVQQCSDAKERVMLIDKDMAEQIAKQIENRKR
jgi:uncharacterized Fe-S cluster-containing radical SAM superfamily protein